MIVYRKKKELLSAYKQYDRSIWKLNIELNLYLPALIYCFINIRLTLVFVDFIIDSNDDKLMFIEVKKNPSKRIQFDTDFALDLSVKKCLKFFANSLCNKKVRFRSEQPCMQTTWDTLLIKHTLILSSRILNGPLLQIN